MGRLDNLNSISKRSICEFYEGWNGSGINEKLILIIVEANCKDDQRSLRSSRAIFDQGGSNDAKQRPITSKFSCILFKSIHFCFLTLVAVISNLLTELV